MRKMSDEGRRERVTTVLTRSEREATETLAREKGVTVSSLLRECLLETLKEAA